MRWSTVRDWFRRCEDFVLQYTEGLRAQDVKRLFDQEASAAFDVLARGQEDAPASSRRIGRLWHRLKVLFLGLSYKLTPVRRILFAISLFLTLLGLIDWGPHFDFQGRIVVSASPLWFVLAIGGFFFLLTLELVDQIRVRDELEVARQLQVDLLPAETPELDEYEIAHSYRTANEVGGDYYDFPLLADGRLVLLAGDASGHGMGAGLLMAIANASVQVAIDLDPQPLPVLSLVNRALCRTSDKRAFMSLFYGLLDPESGLLSYCSAGHPFPLLRRQHGEILELGRGSLPLGMRDSLELAADEVVLEPGDLLVLFSDGLPEAVNAHEHDFGYSRLRNLLSAYGTAEEIHHRIVDAFDAHLAGKALDDDWSLVVLGRLPKEPPPAPERS